MNKWLLLILAALLLSFGLTVGISCGDDDDDDDDDTAGDDDDDDDDTAAENICKNGDIIDPLPDAGMTPTSNCVSCHDGGTAQMGHDGVYDDNAPDSCMAVGCHGCETD